MSLSARRAWIEIKVRYPWTPLTSVALRKESVDRNYSHAGKFFNLLNVALRKESVDRNKQRETGSLFFFVALRKESVDRNDIRDPAATLPSVALRKESVDRNKIRVAPIDSVIDVALRKESVDRNCHYCDDVSN